MTFFVNNVVVLLHRVSGMLLLLRMTGSVHTVVDHVVHTVTKRTTMFTTTKAVGVVLLQQGTIPMIMTKITTKSTTTKITTTTTTKGTTTCWSTAICYHRRHGCRMVTTTCRRCRTCCTHPLLT